MKILIGCDHAGKELKDEIVKILKEKYVVIESSIPYSPTDDYPDFVFDLAKKMNFKDDFCILICSNGIGISMAANKVNGMRCGRVFNNEDVIAAKAHNHANSISFAANTPLKKALEFIELLISTPCSKEERHCRRVKKIIDYENGEYNEL